MQSPIKGGPDGHELDDNPVQRLNVAERFALCQIDIECLIRWINQIDHAVTSYGDFEVERYKSQCRTLRNTSRVPLHAPRCERFPEVDKRSNDGMYERPLQNPLKLNQSYHASGPFISIVETSRLIWYVAGLPTRNKVVIVDIRVKDNLVRDKPERKCYAYTGVTRVAERDV